MTSGEDDKNRSVQPPPFQGAPNYPQQPPAGYPQPAQPYVSGKFLMFSLYGQNVKLSD